MTNRLRTVSAVALFAIALFSLAPANAAVPVLTPIDVARVFTAAGAAGCTVSGATVATPSVITCAAAHNLVTGDQVQITGVGGTTTDNVTAYALVLSSTTFSIWSDATTSTSAIAGVGAYTSGG